MQPENKTENVSQISVRRKTTSQLGWRARINEVRKRKVGLRALLKSVYVYSKGTSQNGKHLSSFLVNGNVALELGKNIKIVNNGTLNIGLPKLCVPSKRPCILRMCNNSELTVEDSFTLSPGTVVSLGEDAELTAGDVFVNSDSKIICQKQIAIGHNVTIGWDVLLCDSDFHYLIRDDFAISKPIEIGNDVWIASRAAILKGVKIDDGAVVAAGSVVTRSVPSHCLVAGVPARVVRENVHWRTKNQQQLF
jgi:acetyltransferase-like isoleucine patch superfamily enzyme